jgi:hypothetical protein
LNIKSPPFAAQAPCAEPLMAKSALVYGLLRTRNDAAKERIREWFCQMDDRRLLKFGLTPVDIIALRGEVRFLSD